MDDGRLAEHGTSHQANSSWSCSILMIQDDTCQVAAVASFGGPPRDAAYPTRRRLNSGKNEESRMASISNATWRRPDCHGVGFVFRSGGEV